MRKLTLLSTFSVVIIVCTASCTDATPVSADIESWTNGSGIADYLLTVAKANNGVVALDSFGTKICVEPPGGLGMPQAQRLHGKPVAYEESDDSNNFWFISIERSNYVYVYAIPLSKIKWQTKDVPRRDYCPKAIKLDFQDSTPVLDFE